MTVVSGWVESNSDTKFGKSFVKGRGGSRTGHRKKWSGHVYWNEA